MANSFQDQLLKAGLVDDKKLKKVKKENYKKNKQNSGKDSAIDNEAKRLAQKAITEKAERDRQLNRKIKEETEQKAIQAQIRQLIEMNRIAKVDGDSSYNFVDNNVVKTLHVSAEIHRQISNGRLAIVRLDEGHELVPAQVAERIEMRDPSVVILRNDKQKSESLDDDPYADYQVPDDLMW